MTKEKLIKFIMNKANKYYHDDFPIENIENWINEFFQSEDEKWIKCSERLPESRIEVLAYAKEYLGDFSIIKAICLDKYEKTGRKPEYKFYECCHCSGYECDDMRIEEVTHWMPLPPTDSIDKEK